MRLCTVSADGLEPFFGVELGKSILRVQAALEVFGASPAEFAATASLHAYFENLPKSEKIVRGILKRVAEKPKDLARVRVSDGFPPLISREKVAYLPPIARPGKFLCIGLNYKDHCEEQGVPLPKTPMVFNKFATSLLGHGGEIPLPLKRDKAMDYEGELGVVIGKRAKNVSKRAAMKHVAGYTIVNDVSARTLQANEKQWARAKGFDGSAPYGPAIVTADEVPDPHALSLITRVNGKVLQNGNTNQLVFNIPHLISFISEMLTLEPGDIISTGTPAGVGKWRKPEVYLKPGDTVEVEIERLGKLHNACVEG